MATRAGGGVTRVSVSSSSYPYPYPYPPPPSSSSFRSTSTTSSSSSSTTSSLFFSSSSAYRLLSPPLTRLMTEVVTQDCYSVQRRQLLAAVASTVVSGDAPVRGVYRCCALHTRSAVPLRVCVCVCVYWCARFSQKNRLLFHSPAAVRATVIATTAVRYSI